MRRSHGLGLIRCPETSCNIIFSSNLEKKNHVQKCHLKMICCPHDECGSVFNDALNLQKHIDHNHLDHENNANTEKDKLMKLTDEELSLLRELFE